MTETIGIIAGESPLPLLSLPRSAPPGMSAPSSPPCRALAAPELAAEADDWAEFSARPAGRR